MHQAVRRQDQRDDWVVTVDEPWTWVSWPHDVPLVDEDPDRTGNRVQPRSISTFPVDWGRIFEAVLYATWGLPDAGHLQLEPVTVELPFLLTDLEHEIVQSWVGGATPVTISWDYQGVTDGRHRLWLTRAFHASRGFIPLKAESLHFLPAAFNGDLPTEVVLAGLDDAATWWEEDSGHIDRRELVESHRRVLALAAEAITAPNPVPSHWFRRLHDWDNTIETLADLHRRGRTDEHLLREHLVNAWRDKQGLVHVDYDLVRDMFRRIGFHVDTTAASPPRGKLILYRGATATNRYGPSWTTNPDIAIHFMQVRQSTGVKAHLWRTTVTGRQLLAHICHESEYLVDLNPQTDTVELVRPTDSKPSRMTRWRTHWLQRRAQRCPPMAGASTAGADEPPSRASGRGLVR